MYCIIRVYENNRNEKNEYLTGRRVERKRVICLRCYIYIRVYAKYNTCFYKEIFMSASCLCNKIHFRGSPAITFVLNNNRTVTDRAYYYFIFPYIHILVAVFIKFPTFYHVICCVKFNDMPPNTLVL